MSLVCIICLFGDKNSILSRLCERGSNGNDDCLWVIRVILGIIIGLAICYALCAFGVIAGVIGLIGGFIFGMFLPAIIAFAWRVLKWWGKLIFVVIIVAALIAVLL